MPRKTPFLLAASLLVSAPGLSRASGPPPVAPAAQEPLAALLLRIARHQERLAPLYERGAFTVATRAKENGRVRESVTRVSSEAGKPGEEILSWIEDGKDLTAQKARSTAGDYAAGRRTRADAIPFRNPFDATEQGRYEFRHEGADPEDASRVRVSFRPRGDARSPALYRGVASVEPGSGALRRASFSPTELPRFARACVIDLEFDAETPLGFALSRVRIAGRGGAAFIRRHVQVESRVRDYALPGRT